MIEARGGAEVIIDASLKANLSVIQNLADEICSQLKTILDQEP
jgi:hypothetical protein